MFISRPVGLEPKLTLRRNTADTAAEKNERAQKIEGSMLAMNNFIGGKFDVENGDEE